MSQMKIILFLIISLFWLINDLHASNSDDIQDLLQEINQLRIDIQRTTASFLLIAGQFENDSEEFIDQLYIRITSRTADIRETNLLTSAVLAVTYTDEEYLIEEERGDWFNVIMRDGRQGWIYKDDGQISGVNKSVQKDGTNKLSSDDEVRKLFESLYNDISNKNVTAGKFFVDFEVFYESMTSRERDANVILIESYHSEKEKIHSSYAYATHYYRKLSSAQQVPVVHTTKQPLHFNGTLFASLGSSSYEAAGKQTATSRTLNLAGNVIINPQTNVNVNLNHSLDVVQTPYAANNVNLQLFHSRSELTRIRANLLYNSYNDEQFRRNNFKNVVAGFNLEHELRTDIRFFGDIQANSKSFEAEGGNEFQGAGFNSGLIFHGQNRQADIGIRGRLQSSDISFLDYTRINPVIRIRFLTKNGSFSIRGEGEKLNYAREAEGNNHNLGIADLEWIQSARVSTLRFMIRQYPNNPDFDQMRFRFQNQWRRSSAGVFRRTSLSVQYVYHTGEGTRLSDYLDLRADRSIVNENIFFDLNLFGRYWDDKDRLHRIDFFSRFGYKFQKFEIGPVIGAQFLLDPNDITIERNGNSLRAGIEGRVHTVIQKATLYGTFRYQKSYVYSNKISIDTSTGLITEGEIKTRMPSTIQFSAGVHIPLGELFLLRADLSYYSIDLDVSEEISINPVDSRSGLRLTGGIQYRFNQQQFRR